MWLVARFAGGGFVVDYGCVALIDLGCCVIVTIGLCLLFALWCCLMSGFVYGSRHGFGFCGTLFGLWVIVVVDYLSVCGFVWGMFIVAGYLCGFVVSAAECCLLLL